MDEHVIIIFDWECNGSLFAELYVVLSVALPIATCILYTFTTLVCFVHTIALKICNQY